MLSRRIHQLFRIELTANYHYCTRVVHSDWAKRTHTLAPLFIRKQPTNVQGIRSISHDAKKTNKARDEGYRDGFNVGRRKGLAEGLKRGYLRALEDVGRTPKTPRDTPSSTATKSDVGDKGGQDPVISRDGPAWKAAMAASGTKIGVTMGMYMDGDIKVNGKHATTVLRIPPCERCRRMGRSDCRVLDLAKEENLVTRMCNHCIRAGTKCAT